MMAEGANDISRLDEVKNQIAETGTGLQIFRVAVGSKGIMAHSTNV